ncbi:MAG: class I SAM-dependent methyltransferase [Acidobacteriota bacterium]
MSGTDEPNLPGPGESTRALDRRYLDRPPGEHHRPYFDLIRSRMADRLAAAEPISVLDIGSANGAFLHFLLASYPNVRAVGIDALPELVAYATAQVPAASFRVGDIRDPATLPAERFDFVTMLTLHSHFDHLDPWFEDVLGRVAPGGRLLLFGTFNPQPVDLLVRLRQVGEGEALWMPGWNIHSRQTFEDRLSALGLRFAFHEYRPPGKLLEQPDPLRSRPAVLDGREVLVNGAGLILPFALLEIWIDPSDD